MPTVLITGYGGFLGAAIARQLLDKGYTVRGLARSQYPELKNQGVLAWEGSIADRAVVQRALQGADAVIHTAAKAGIWGRYADYYATNTLATQSLLDAAQAAGCETFVFTSSPSVTFAGENQSGIDESVPYPSRWLCAYPQTKALAEMAVLECGRHGRLWTAALRPHLIWGSGDPHLMPRVVDKALSGQLKRVGHGRNLIDIVHVDNAARAHVLALEQLLARNAAVNGQAFFITDGQPIACWEWITQILQTAGLPVPRGSLSYPIAYSAGAMFEGIYRLAGVSREPPMTRFVAAQLALDHYFSIDKARQLLGYQPEQDQEAKLSACRTWLTQRKSARR